MMILIFAFSDARKAMVTKDELFFCEEALQDPRSVNLRPVPLPVNRVVFKNEEISVHRMKLRFFVMYGC